jgi:FkbM family methyltransferase
VAFTPTRALLASNAVNLVIRDLLNPGDFAFDVGAYSGWLTALMSRLVGPTGRIVSFEADFENLEKCQRYLQQQCSTNYTLVYAAICDMVGTAQLFTYPKDRQVSTLEPTRISKDHTPIEVPALTLDAYIRENDFFPVLLKVDVEGSELRVLEGAVEYIAWRHPILILEQQPHDKRCAQFLEKFGYIGIDAADYQPFNEREYPPEAAVADVLYFCPGHSARLDLQKFHSIPVGEFQPKMYNSADGAAMQSGPIELDAGRYALESDFMPGPGNEQMRQSIKVSGQPIAMNGAGKRWLWRSFRRIPFHLYEPAAVTLEYRAIKPGALDGLTCNGIKINVFPGLQRSPKINEI